MARLLADETVSQIRAVSGADRPVLLPDLAALSCRWFDPTRSVVNDRFDASRPRLLRDDKVDYDLIMRQAKGSAETNKGA